MEAHPYLSMTIAYGENGEPMARRSADNLIEVDDWEHLPQADALVLPFDLSEGKKLCRAAVIDSQAGKYLFMDMHHIVADDASVQILLQDIQTAYDGGELTEEGYSGFEYALDEQKQRGSEEYAAARAWYESHCKGSDSQTLPAAEANLKRDGRNAAAQRYAMPRADRVRAWCGKAGVSLSAFFTAAFGISVQNGQGNRIADHRQVGRKECFLLVQSPRCSPSFPWGVYTLIHNKQYKRLKSKENLFKQALFFMFIQKLLLNRD